MTRSKQKDAGPASRSEGSAGTHAAFLSVDVDGGWMKGAKVEFPERFTSVTGPNGSGKTTLLEILRLVVGDSRVGVPAKGERVSGLQRRLGDGTVRVKIRTADGGIFLVERSWGEPVRVSDESGAAVGADLVRDLGFAPEAYGHHELQEIATDDVRLLQIIDAVDPAMRSIDNEIKQVKLDLEENAKRLLLIAHGSAPLRALAAELEGAQAAVAQATAAGGPKVAQLDDAHLAKARREKERGALESLPAYLRKLRLELDAVGADGARRLEGWIGTELASGVNEPTLGALAKRLHDMASGLRDSAGGFGRAALDAEAAVADTIRSLANAHAKQEADYQALLAESMEAVGRAKARAEGMKRLEDARTADRELKNREEARRQRAAERDGLREKLVQLRLRRTELREMITAEWTKKLNGRVTIGVTPEEGREKYQEMLRDAFRSQGIKSVGDVAKWISQRVMPDELVRHVERAEVDRLAERAKIERSQAEDVVQALAATEMLYAIEVVDLPDRPALALVKDGNPVEAESLSMGERCAAVLPVLLVASRQPLLVDEPEGNLSHYFLSETLARTLKETEQSRQFIFATHNASIPVIGGADLVIYMEGNTKATGFAKVGTVDELRREIERHCDGGEDAFKERMKLYGY